ncbi:MAG: COX15/CtaA family protein [Cephaloticoccus sp.]|nr:COX15/CtaA family protein [Cephaloticoccus sp.]MCF7759156.1 COX15/CtaA family protein [Cephaloticoccus sp.]
MSSTTPNPPPPVYQPALAWFALIGGAWVFVLVTLGAFTTTIGAGMAFGDWPLSNGSVNPHGWLEDIAMFAEHSHRLSGTMMGLITIVLAVWLARKESRRWVRRLGWAALAIVVVQGVLGGTRVLFDAIHVPGFEMTLGQMLRIPHGVLAQLYICVLIIIATALSRSWIEHSRPVTLALRHSGVLCVVLLLLQLTVAATMRHNFAGLAIPTFPYSTTEGQLLPAHWDYRVGLNFAHRLMAVVLSIALLWFALKLWTDRGASLLMRCGASVMISMLALQILLGAHIIWQMREVHVTTGHVVVGALLLAVTFWLTCLAHRDAIEDAPEAR